jgi:hypothetical protein
MEKKSLRIGTILGKNLEESPYGNFFTIWSEATGIFQMNNQIYIQLLILTKY